ncbi:MAG: ABC1 kinase family protein [Acidimicrobiales bacterium]
MSLTQATSVPLPDARELLARSEWAAAQPGLTDAAYRWMRALPAERDQLAAQARDLGRPRLWPDTVAAVARTGWRIVATAAPETPTILLVAGARALGLPIRPPDPSRAVLRRVEQLVRSGGPAYVKLGQFIATARGLLPDDWVDAFAWCRDEVPPLPPGTAERVIEHALGGHPRDLFASFAPEPVAAASIAQVHHAVLRDGTEVVVKVRRPGLRPRFAEAIQAMAVLAAGAEQTVEAARIANLSGFVELFAQLVLEELDFRFEALNMVEIGLANEDAGGVGDCTVPRPCPELVTSRVLVMERVTGVRYTDAADQFGTRLDGDRLLRLAIQGVLEHALVYGVFHGDLHAGNVLIDNGDRFALVDFGICGRVDARQRAALVRMNVAFAQMDTVGQLAALQEFGAIPFDADVAALAAELDAETEQIGARLGVDFNDPATFASVGMPQLVEAMGSLVRLLARNGFRLPKELVLFFKNILYLNGFAEAVAPTANVFGEINPVLAYFQAKHGDTIARLLTSPLKSFE